MKTLITCRRTFIAFTGMIILGIALISGTVDTSSAIAAICIGVASANSYENSKTIQGKK